MKKVVVIGAGNIGSRHLQALANVKECLEIYVVEPNVEAMDLSEARFLQIDGCFKHKFIRCKSISELPEKIDLATISTSSGPRLKVLEELTENKEISNLVLEKFLFTDEQSFYRAKEIIDKKKIKAWVNNPRRAYSFYKKLRDYLSDSKYVSMNEIGGKWGLACNGIHEFDLFSMLQGDLQEYSIDSSGLDDKIYDSKRTGYSEFNGTIEIKSKKGTAIITCFADIDYPTVKSIRTDKGIFEICESSDECVYRVIDNGFETKTIKMEIKPVSVLMTEVYEDIISKGTCDLPSYDMSMKLHVLFLNALLSKQNIITGDKENKKCQIT